MEFLVSWLADYVDLGPDIELEVDSGGRHFMRTVRTEGRAEISKLRDELTSLGLSVEAVPISMFGTEQELKLDVEVTSNRPDCMNHFGLAREIAVKRKQALRKAVFPFTESLPRGGPKISVKLEDPEGCPRFTARVIRGVRIGSSPEWLVRRLEAIGSRSINNVVDATNLCLWETGQPMHAYDLETIPEGEIRVRRARAGEKLTTLDGKERELDTEVLVIADRGRAIGLAGIMGGLDTELTARTSAVLLESAHFDRRRIRIGAKRLGLHTDASHRFERGADYGVCEEASRRCAALIAEIAGGTIEAGAVDAQGPRPEPVGWRLSGPELERFGGVAVPDSEIERILSGLGFAPRRVGERLWEGEVPSWREIDFEPRRAPVDDGETRARREAWRQDLFEEVLRHVGFEGIPSTLPAIGGVDPGVNAEHDRRDRLRDRLVGFGYAEAIHYAFGKRSWDRELPRLVGTGDPIALANPLSELFAVMRRSLVPGLVTAGEFNSHRGARGVKLFESGHLFPGGDAAEVEALALVCGGTLGGEWDHHLEAELLALKGEVEAVFADLGVVAEVAPAAFPGIIPGSGAVWTLSGVTIGYLGQVGATDSAFPLFAAEILLDRLPSGRERIRIEPPSRFPGIEVDLTLKHPLAVSWGELEMAIRAEPVPDLASLALKARYQGAGVPAGAVATTVTFQYVSAERSLTQDEVNARHAPVVAALEARFGIAREEKR